MALVVFSRCCFRGFLRIRGNREKGKKYSPHFLPSLREKRKRAHILKYLYPPLLYPSSLTLLVILTKK